MKRELNHLTKMFGVFGLLVNSYAFAVCDTTKVIQVEIKDMKFIPAHVDLCLGQTIEWTNNEPADVPEPMNHTVTADPARATKPENFKLPEGVAPFHSKRLVPGAKWSYTFATLGDYQYFCQPHQDMGHIGTVKVLEEITEPAPVEPTPTEPTPVEPAPTEPNPTEPTPPPPHQH